MASDLVRFSVAIPEGLLVEFDEYTRRRGVLVNRSEAIRDLMREKIIEDELSSPDAEVVGSITMVYDHHMSDLSHQLDKIQHANIPLIVSTMHVHLDRASCLEILAVRGRRADVCELADQLLGIKGVRHGKLACTVLNKD